MHPHLEKWKTFLALGTQKRYGISRLVGKRTEEGGQRFGEAWFSSVGGCLIQEIKEARRS